MIFSICGMDSQYYCMECMQGGEGPIPSRVLLNWDWGCRKLSHRGRTFIDANQEKAVIDIQKVNPQLYKRIPVMANILVFVCLFSFKPMVYTRCSININDNF